MTRVLFTLKKISAQRDLFTNITLNEKLFHRMVISHTHPLISKKNYVKPAHSSQLA